MWLWWWRKCDKKKDLVEKIKDIMWNHHVWQGMSLSSKLLGGQGFWQKKEEKVGEDFKSYVEGFVFLVGSKGF